MNENKVLDTKEMASYLNCSVSTIRNFVKNKKIPNFKIGGKIYFNLLSIEEWIKENERK